MKPMKKLEKGSNFRFANLYETEENLGHNISKNIQGKINYELTNKTARFSNIKDAIHIEIYCSLPIKKN